MHKQQNQVGVDAEKSVAEHETVPFTIGLKEKEQRIERQHNQFFDSGLVQRAQLFQVRRVTVTHRQIDVGSLEQLLLQRVTLAPGESEQR